MQGDCYGNRMTTGQAQGAAPMQTASPGVSTGAGPSMVLAFASQAQDPTVSLFRNASVAVPLEDLPIERVLRGIRLGKWRKPIEEIRCVYQAALRRGDDPKKAVAGLKKKLPAVTISGTFGRRCNDGVKTHSGLLCADLDHLGPELASVRAKLEKSPFLFACFTSPTGTGLKALFRVPADATKHKESFEAVKKHVQAIGSVCLDTGCKDVSRLCFVSFDPVLFHNPAAQELTRCCTDLQTYRLPDEQTNRPTCHKEQEDEGQWALDFMPTCAHETNKLFFDMARRLKDLEKAAGRKFSLGEVRQAFNKWFDSANPAYLSETLETYFMEFLRLRSYVKRGLSEQPIAVAWERAQNEPLPVEAAGFDNDLVRRLVALCFHLQAGAGQSPFFLSSYDAARLLGVAPNQAYRWLRTLVGAGVLDCTTPGDSKTHRATEYQYIQIPGLAK